jgi:phospholipase C
MSGASDDPIKHVVLLILENHSFDQLLGCFTAVYPELDGVDPAKPPRTNADNRGTVFQQIETKERQVVVDPHHEIGHVAVQMENGNAGFLKDFSDSFPDSTDRQRQFVMGYYQLDFLPALHRLACDFTICDRWFSSVPGPTWTNRFFALTGTSNGRVNMPGDGEHTVDLPGWFQQDQPTLFDRLTQKGIDWRVYFHDIPQTSVLVRQRLSYNVARYFYKDRFFRDCLGDEADFPQFSFIEPDYMGADENDAHPPHDVMKSEKLIADVYNAIRANDQLWRSTLLVVFYDEHGGFYDHVVPPAALAPDEHHEEYSFEQFGLRVPALLISPWVERGVLHTQFDHTSLLKYLIEKWGLDSLGARTAQANSIGPALGRAHARQDTIVRIELTQEQLSSPDPDTGELASAHQTAHHRALAAIFGYLKVEADELIPKICASLARAIEKIRDGLAAIVSRLYDEPPGLPVSNAEPDRVKRTVVPVRERYAQFLHHQKRRAILAISRRLQKPGLSAPREEHAVRTLALLTGRRFHREPEKAANARRWLRSRNQYPRAP